MFCLGDNSHANKIYKIERIVNKVINKIEQSFKNVVFYQCISSNILFHNTLHCSSSITL